jgi:Asp-tRNA(Asn)/Glu-tRNA(Gln) amidotransferase A subunit family amidase
MCRDAEDTRLLGEVLLGRPLGGSQAPLRIGVPRGQLWDDLDPEVERACREGVDALRDGGAELREIELEGTEHALIATVLRLSLEGVPAAKPELFREIEEQLSPVTRALSKYQLLIPAAALMKAERVRAQLRRSLARAFGRCDLLAWPSVPAAAPPIDEPTVHLPSGSYPADYANVRLGGIANLTGAPAGSAPCGFVSDGLPVGLQLLAPWREEGRVLEVAALLERATDRRYVEALPPLAARAAA